MVRLMINGRRTRTYEFLCMACHVDGVTPSGASYANEYQYLNNLERAGYVQRVASGPRGGTFYHATDQGRRALLESSRVISTQ